MVQGTLALRRGVWHLSGTIDAHTDLLQILKSTEPVLRLNLSAVDSITSIGTRKLRDFIDVAGGRPIELQECPSVLVDTFNSVRLLDRAGVKAKVTSVYAPYDCQACSIIGMGILVQIAEVKLVNDQVTPPVKQCTCGGRMVLAVDAHEYFYLLTNLFNSLSARS